jgi:glutamate synthase (NADPH/NADH) small chain
VQRRVDFMEAEGIRICCLYGNRKRFPAKKLVDDFDAVILCCGATKPRDLPVEGSELRVSILLWISDKKYTGIT